MDFKKVIPHLIAAAILLLASAVFFAPNAFQGKVLPQPDNDKAFGMQREIQDYLKKGESSPLWTNSAFGGMPSYQIYVKSEGDLLRPLARAPFLWRDLSSVWTQVFAAMLLMYLFLSVLRLDWRVAMLGALGYGITTYNIDILEAGHTTKMLALALAPGMLSGAVLLLRGRWWEGSGLLAFFTAAQIYVNHVQITYYTLLLLGLFFLFELFQAIREKTLVHWGKAVVLAGLTMGLGVATNAAKLLSTLEYSKETIRGKSELKEKASKGDGLDKDYLFGWSYGVKESMTLLVPHFAGGGSNEKFKDTKLYKAVPAENRRGIAGLFYTGEQPFVGTAIYFGAVLIFLALLGALLAQGAIRWWLLSSALLMVSLAWGKHFFLNHLFYDYLPMFNKFRAVSMALGVAQLAVAALAAIGLQRFISSEVTVSAKQKALYISAGVTIGLSLLSILLAESTGPNDEALGGNAQLLKLLQDDRSSLVSGDAFRSAGFIALAAFLMFLYTKGSLQATVLSLSLVGVSLVDNWTVCTRTISSDKYTSAKSVNTPPAPEKFDQQILADPDIHYRVLDLARGGITANATNSYFHKSINGYHAAKLQRFQEVVERYLGANLAESLPILGMMNTKYIITQKGEVIQNPEACGHAWFVRHVSIVPDGDAELAALETLNPKDSAVVQQSFAAALEGLNLVPDSTARIELTNYHPDRMTYTYSAASEQLAVFPEQYYPADKGWKCYLNGQPYQDIIKANYLLRALRVPAGKDMVLEMRFEPASWKRGTQIGSIASILVLLLLGAGLFFWYRSGSKEGNA